MNSRLKSPLLAAVVVGALAAGGAVYAAPAFAGTRVLMDDPAGGTTATPTPDETVSPVPQETPATPAPTDTPTSADTPTDGPATTAPTATPARPPATDTSAPTATSIPTQNPTLQPTATPKPPADTTAPAGTFKLSLSSFWVGQRTALTQVGVADNGVVDPAAVTRVVTWGDGTSSTLTPGASPVLKQYTRVGRFAVTLTLTDAAGNKTVRTAAVTVTNPGHFKISKTAVWHHESFAVTISSVPAGTSRIVLNFGDGHSIALKGKNQTVTRSYTTVVGGGVARPGPIALTAVYVNKNGATVPLAVGRVTIKRDSWRPTVTISKPAHPERASSWRTVRGTAADKGSGVQTVAVIVLRTIGTKVYCYTTRNRWLRLDVAGADAFACVHLLNVTRGKWSLSVSGLGKGQLGVVAVAGDWAGLVSKSATVNRKLTR